MISWLFYNISFAEPATRWLLYRFPNIKKKIKKSHGTAAPKMEFDSEAWEKYKKLVSDSVEDNDILLFHTSMDGLRNIGVEDEEVLNFLKSFIERGCTVVTTAFPITNLPDKVKDNKMKPYNPAVTPCWTGMLSNYFIAEPEAIRSRVPYNTLAAMGPKAEEMMANDFEADYVYGEGTPWKYCVDHHAKILFIGTTSVESNTIQTHMMADYMGDKWPIDNWYEEYECPVKIDGEKLPKKLYIQSNYWTQYVMDFATTKKMEKKGYLKKYTVKDCPFEVVADAYEMVKYLESECNRGKLTYLIPKKYWKKK